MCPVIGLAVQNDIQIFNIADIERINSECRSVIVIWEYYNVVVEVKCCVGVAACVVEKSCSIICSNIIAFAGLCIFERNSLCVSLCLSECINIDSACVLSYSIVALADSFLELSLISSHNTCETVSLCLLNRVGEVGHFCIAVGDLLICIRCQSNTTLSDSGFDILSNILEVAVCYCYLCRMLACVFQIAGRILLGRNSVYINGLLIICTLIQYSCACLLNIPAVFGGIGEGCIDKSRTRRFLRIRHIWVRIPDFSVRININYCISLRAIVHFELNRFIIIINLGHDNDIICRRVCIVRFY